MKYSELEYVQEVVENEGFDYAFLHYSDFSGIEDVEFHKLRLDYIHAAKSLANYLGDEV